MLKQVEGTAGMSTMEAVHPELGTYRLYGEGDVPLLFTENETNNALLFPQYPNPSPYVKDGINNFVVHGQQEAINPSQGRNKGGGPLSDHRR